MDEEEEGAIRPSNSGGTTSDGAVGLGATAATTPVPKKKRRRHVFKPPPPSEGDGKKDKVEDENGSGDNGVHKRIRLSADDDFFDISKRMKSVEPPAAANPEQEEESKVGPSEENDNIKLVDEDGFLKDATPGGESEEQLYMTRDDYGDEAENLQIPEQYTNGTNTTTTTTTTTNNNNNNNDDDDTDGNDKDNGNGGDGFFVDDGGELIEDSDVEVMEENHHVGINSDDHQGDNAVANGSNNPNTDNESVGDGEDVPVVGTRPQHNGTPEQRHQSAAEEDFEKRVQSYLDLGLGVDTARGMVKRDLQESQHAVFTAAITVKPYDKSLSRHKATFEIKSNETFGKLKDLYLDFLVNKQKLRATGRLRKLAENSVFIAKNVKLYKTSTPNALKVSHRDPILTVQLMTPEQFDQMNKLRDEHIKNMIDMGYNRQDADKEWERELEDQIEKHAREAEAERDKQAGPGDGFRVVMRGADESGNEMRVEVRVRPETKVSSMADYYRQQCELAASSKVVLEFDDEPLELDQVVGDTELEEDFTIDVHVK